MATASTIREHRSDPLRALGVVALNGMFDEMDALGVLRYAASDVLPGDLAIVSSFGAAPGPMTRFAPAFLHSGHFFSGSALIDWNASQVCPHFLHS